ncbi:MAG: hypothetical protein GY855_10790 [candidate division Zixibacteria bacterium]|nr:hypothetical protein [candidate division Zixibacteria bacterium]
MTRKIESSFGSGYYSRAIAGCTLIFTFLLLFILAGYNLMIMADDFRKGFTIQVYVDKSSTENSIREIETSIWNVAGVSEVKFISSEDALVSMKGLFGEEIFSGLKINPLPSGFEVKLDRGSLGWDNMERIVNAIKPLKGISEIDYGGDLLKKVDTIREFVITIGLIFLVVISLAATAVASNAAQILYFRDKEKIDIMNMLGATDLFMARPLIIQGFFIGLISSIIAILFSLASYMVISDNLIQLEFIPPHILLAVVVWAGLWSAYGGYSGFIRGKKTGNFKQR